MENTWRQLQEQWQSNPRLRILLGVVVFILVVTLLQALHQARHNAYLEAQKQWQRLGDVQQLSSVEHWAQRAEQGQQVLDSLNQHIWQASSEGQAQAQLRDVLQRYLNEHGLDTIRINVTAVPSDTVGFLQVRADLSGTYLPGAWQDFVYSLLKYRPQILIEHDSVNRTNANRNIYRLSVHAWFIIRDES